MDNQMMSALMAHAWGVDIKYNRDGTFKRIVIDVRPGVTASSQMSDAAVRIVEKFLEETKE